MDLIFDVVDSLVAHNSIRSAGFQVTELISGFSVKVMRTALIGQTYNFEDLTHFYEIVLDSKLISSNDNEFIFNDVKDDAVLNLSVLQ